MKDPNYQLNIEKPCSQDWAGMSNIHGEHFCTNCSKVVIDFTDMSDVEIAIIINKSNSKLCGRFKEDQLHRTIIQPVKSFRIPAFSKLISGALLLSLSENALPTKNVITSRISAFEKNKEATQRIPNSEHLSDTLKNIIKGRVTDKDTKEAIPFAAVSIKDKKAGVMTDFDGYFNFTIPDSLLSAEIVIMISSIAYEPIEFTIHKNDLPLTKEIIISVSPQTFIGEVEIVKKKRWWQRKS